MRFMGSIWLALTATVALSAAEPTGKLVAEHWDAAFLNGQKAGHFHTTVVESNRNGQTVLRVTRELQLTVRRFGDVTQVRASTGDEETPEGKLLGVFMTQGLGTNQQLKLSGQVVDGVLHDTIEGKQVPGERVERRIKLPEDILTYLGEENFLKQQRAKPGDRLSYRLFEPTVNNVIRVDLEVKGFEQVPLNGADRKLLRVLSKPQKIQDVQLPSQTQWYDADYRLVLAQGEVPGLGELTLRRGTKSEALAQNGKLQDLGNQSVVLDRAIVEPHRRSKLVLRVTFAKNAEDLGKYFATDDNRQSVHNLSDNSLELHIAALRRPPDKNNNELISDEFLKSNFFINSADEKVQELALEATGTLTDPWQKAQAIERWVKSNMKAVAFTEAMATADHVARTRQGDCTEFAMLTAAMCRAQGVPSRTAIGLVYYTDPRPKLGYHMWTEVFVRGEWLGLDATLGHGSVGPAHVKITDHSWKDVRSMVPLLPVMRVMIAKPKMDVLKVE